ncbi:MAG: LysM peptidoglycan-binding domain-containing protein [Treponema sp.]|nr:LysM peptidoglycan-binding domain-containing protein [Treponema sp.]
MKKNVVFGLLIIALSILVFTGCGGGPAPKPEPAPVTTTATTTQTSTAQNPGSLVLDGATNYTVANGDTLSEIAAKRYGGSNMYFFPLIRLANEQVVPNPDEISVGTVLVIPDLQRNLDNAGANASIRADVLKAADHYDRLGDHGAAQELRNLAARLSR